MNVPEDYDDEVERLNTYPDLIPPADNKDQLLATSSAVLVKALTQRVVTRKAGSNSMVLKPQVVLCKTPRDNLALVKDEENPTFYGTLSTHSK